MDREPIIALHCIRKDGKRETTKLRDHPLCDARELAKWVLHVGNGLYTEVDICTDNGTVERIQNPAGPHGA
jgi:hypothetical protein